MDPIQLLPLSFYVIVAIGIGAVVKHLLNRQVRGDDETTKIDLHS